MHTRRDVKYKLWDMVAYSPLHKCCGNCAHADNADWGVPGNLCGVLAGLKFPIQEQGICKLHSSFNHGNVKYSI